MERGLVQLRGHACHNGPVAISGRDVVHGSSSGLSSHDWFSISRRYSAAEAFFRDPRGNNRNCKDTFLLYWS